LLLLSRSLLLTLFVVVVPACGGSPAQSGASVAVDDGSPGDDTGGVIYVRTLLTGFEEPWGMDFLPDGRLLITEKGGALKLVSADLRRVATIAGVPQSADAGQGGLLDVLVHPDFADNGRIFLSYAVEQDGSYSTRVSRARLDGMRLVELQALFTARPFFRERRHFGSRLLLDDGYLYITVGDRGNRDLAQRLDSHNGKVIRLTEEGTVPPDNPFVQTPGALPEIWTYGHRNPQGIARHPHSGAIWVAEHGPQGGDEINELVAGANYGWPVITYGEEYGGGKIGEGTEKPGMLQPLLYYVPSIGAAGIDFYTSGRYPGWTDSLLVSGLRQTQISRLELIPEGVGRQTRMLADLEMRIRDVQQGPDGLVYALADGSRLIRLQLEP
jgi:glucose/arabinose dehydrogenase